MEKCIGIKQPTPLVERTYEKKQSRTSPSVTGLPFFTILPFDTHPSSSGIQFFCFRVPLYILLLCRKAAKPRAGKQGMGVKVQFEYFRIICCTTDGSELRARMGVVYRVEAICNVSYIWLPILYKMLMCTRYIYSVGKKLRQTVPSFSVPPYDAFAGRLDGKTGKPKQEGRI